DVGQDAFVSAAPSVSAAPRAAGEVADLAFHHGPICSVVLLPFRIPLAGFGVLQRGFMGVDADHPSPAGLRALGAEWARAAECIEARDTMTQASADGHGVVSRAGDSAGGQINAEPVFGKAVGIAHWGHLGAHVAASLGLLGQGGSVGVSRIPVNL